MYFETYHANYGLISCFNYTVYIIENSDHSIKEIIKNRPQDIISLTLKKSTYQRWKSFISVDYYLGNQNSVKVHNIFLPRSLEECKNKRRIILLDCLEDPRNIGSIIRSAAVMNFAVLIRGGCGITETVVRCASGGVDIVPIRYVKNIPRLFKSDLKDFWIIGLSEGASEVDFSPKDNLVFVLGNEGKGISKIVRKNSHAIHTIVGGNNDFTTLNASNAASIIMYKFKI